jgi:anti-sigma regulatory factor (Ser/Thr protein kinase)
MRELRPSSASIELPSSVDAPGTARQFVRDTLATSGLNGAGEVVELLTSEVVTNAVQHADSRMRLRVIRRPTTVRVEVDDESNKIPERHVADSAAEGGRGMLLIEALATEWGVDFRDTGKTVWFEVDLPTQPS